jgi:Subtilase family
MKETRAGLVPASAPGFGVTWGGPPRAASRALTVAAAAAMIAGMAGPAVASDVPPGSADTVSVIVREAPGSGDLPERSVEAAGGSVVRQLALIDSFSARIPADRLTALRAVPGVVSVTEDAEVELHDADVAAVQAETGSLYRVTEVTGTPMMWGRGFDGSGIDVAVIDSGVTPVEGLRTPGKVVYGPDLSTEAEICDAAGCEAGPAENLDSYGHGTHMAGIIAGVDSDVTPAGYRDSSKFVGMAPGSRVVSVKVADAAGSTDVSQVIAGIDWVVQNKDRDGLNIRVLNLSFGTDGVQNYLLDPLTFAAEQAWHAGIVVVVAAGNGGYGTEKLNNPAYDPYVLAVGGVDPHATYPVRDDVVPEWSSTGDGTRNPDVVAPGKSVASLRVPGSYLDHTNPAARAGTRLFRGSGTSQAAAVVSGAAALLLDQRPELSPDQVKALLRGTAVGLPAADPTAQGKGLIDLREAGRAATPSALLSKQLHPRATGLGSLDLARGTAHVEIDGVLRAGEVDVTGAPWIGAQRTVATVARTAWSGGGLLESLIGQLGFAAGSWHGSPWRGHTWNGDTYAGYAWDGASWRFTPWSGEVADGSSGQSWTGKTWSGKTWSGKTWSGKTWSGKTWSGKTWSGKTWSGKTWSGIGWGA